MAATIPVTAKPKLLNTYQLICGTDLKQVQAALKLKINSLGAAGYTTEDLEMEVNQQTQLYKEKLSTAKQEIERLKVNAKVQDDRINELEELQKKKLLEIQQRNAMEIEQTKLQREIVTTRSKEVSATSDMFKVAVGAAVTIGGALLYFFANRSKEIIGRVAVKAASCVGGGLLTGALGFGAFKVLTFGASTLFPPLGIVGGLLGLLF